ncbi:MAG: hypothetical protein J0L67_08015 [Cytophagales bacterium]|nr:hypothetical protein [Cytophagales bacterium]
MKIKHLFPIVLLLALSTFTSCELFDKVDDVNFDVDVPLEFDVNAVGATSYNKQALLNASTDPDVAEYADKIKEFKINKITYTIEGSDATTQTFTGSISVVDGGQVLSNLAGVALTNNTTETELDANLSAFNDLASKLLNDKQELVEFDGTFSDVPVNFTLKLRFYLTVTADAL